MFQNRRISARSNVCQYLRDNIDNGLVFGPIER
jgi:hypothetical protein